MTVFCGINRDNFGAMVVAAGKPPARANGWGIAPDATRYVNILTGAVPAGVSRASGIVFDSDGDLCMTVSKSGARLYQGFLRRDDGVMVATYNPPGAGSRMVHAPIGPLLVDADGAVHISGGFDGTGLAAWYRFGAGITQSGGFASAWADQSGFGRDLLQGTGANQPSVNPDGSLLFDGTSHFMRATFTLNQPCTMYMLARQLSWTSLDAIINGSVATAAIQQATSSPNVRLVGTSNGTLNGNWPLSTYAALCAVWNGASSVFRINNTTEVTNNLGANNPGGIVVSSNLAGTSQFGHQEVKEIVVFSVAHTVSQRAAMVSYLASVGGLSI